jgi:hypothetical protein
MGHATGRNANCFASCPESGSHPSRVSPTSYCISKKNHRLMSNFQQRYVLRFWELHRAKLAIAVTSRFPPCADPRGRLSSEGSWIGKPEPLEGLGCDMRYVSLRIFSRESGGAVAQSTVRQNTWPLPRSSPCATSALSSDLPHLASALNVTSTPVVPVPSIPKHFLPLSLSPYGRFFPPQNTILCWLSSLPSCISL